MQTLANAEEAGYKVIKREENYFLRKKRKKTNVKDEEKKESNIAIFSPKSSSTIVDFETATLKRVNDGSKVMIKFSGKRIKEGSQEGSTIGIR